MEKNKKINLILTGLICLCLNFATMPVLAYDVSENYGDSEYNVLQQNIIGTSWLYASVNMYATLYSPTDSWTDFNGLYYMALSSDQIDSVSLPAGTEDEEDNFPIELRNSGYTIFTGDMSWRISRGLLNNPTHIDIWINIDEPDISYLNTLGIAPSANMYQFWDTTHDTQLQLARISTKLKDDVIIQIGADKPFISFADKQGSPAQINGVYGGLNIYAALNTWSVSIKSSDFDYNKSNELEINSYSNKVNVTLYDESDYLVTFSDAAGWRTINYFGLPYNVKFLNPIDSEIEYTLELKGTQTENTVKILTHVYSTADNSLIGGATVTYNATDGSDLQSKTLPTGEGIFTLLKNVEYIESAEAEGYIPQTSTDWTAIFPGDTQSAIYLTPLGENVTAGNGAVNFHVSAYTSSGSLEPLPGALIQIGNQTLITNAAGFAQTEISKTASLSYVISKTGYVSFSRTYTPSWPSDVIDEYPSLRATGQILPGEPTPAPTQDTRNINQKTESAFNIIFDNIEAFATLAVMVLFLSFIEWMKPKKRW